MARGLIFSLEREDFCTSYEAKTKAPVTAKLSCVFVFAFAKSRFSHDQAHLVFNESSTLGSVVEYDFV